MVWLAQMSFDISLSLRTNMLFGTNNTSNVILSTPAYPVLGFINMEGKGDSNLYFLPSSINYYFSCTHIHLTNYGNCNF